MGHDCKITNCFEDAVILDEPCYFCDNSKIVGFKEHYSFCPNCSAIYTFMIVRNKFCEHISDNTPVVDRQPWNVKYRERPHILNINGGATQKCSKCNKYVLADGW